MITDLPQLLRSLRPQLNPGTWVFTTIPQGVEPSDFSDIVSSIEVEGWCRRRWSD